MVYVDSSRADLVDGFTRKTFTAMVEGVREAAISPPPPRAAQAPATASVAIFSPGKPDTSGYVLATVPVGVAPA